MRSMLQYYRAQKMFRITCAYILGALSSVAYFGFCVRAIDQCVSLNHFKDYVPNYDIRLGVKVVTSAYLGLMSLTSALMIWGVRKQRHSLISPWIIFGLIGIIYNILNFFITVLQLPLVDVIINLILLVVNCSVWYPIFSLWRDMRKGICNVAYLRHRTPAQDY